MGLEQTNEKNGFHYSDKEHQLIRVNRFMMLAYSVYCVYIGLLLTTSYLRQERSLSLCIMIAGILIAGLVLVGFTYHRNKKSKALRYLFLISLCTASWIITFAYERDFAVIIGACALVGGIIYYDIKYLLIASGTYSLVVILAMVAKFTSGQNLGGMDIIDACFVVSAVMLLVFITIMTARVARMFNEHSMSAAEAEQLRQKEIMEDVISVADQVRKGTENAMEIINRLNESSEVVNGAMGDISESTQTTAESIQNQTMMTQNIQESINVTIESSEKMVRVAQQSNELNQQNLELMGDLKQQSEVIAQTNRAVAEAMKALQERTNAVKGIADTIFSISNQTNLLALNASIESARAGEAGRGFAVVADEIRQLAAKTRQETENIAIILDELSANAEEAGTAVNRSMDAAEVQDDMIEKVSMSFEEMSRNVNGLIVEIQNIDGMLSSLSEANNKIVDNITYLSATTEEVTSSSVQASDMTVENLSNAETAKEELSNILQVSHQLDKYMS